MNQSIGAVLFDLDDTLLENDMDRFLKGYFDLLTSHMAHLVKPEKLVSALITATHAMIQNRDPAVTNQQAFMAAFFVEAGRTADEMMPLFDDFYVTQFGRLRSLTRPDPAARASIRIARDSGCDVVIATNPVFPETAIRQRMEWAGITDFDFKLVTCYETMHATKPSTRYYREILDCIGRRPEECIMVGNDWDNDIMPAMELGLQVFWVRNGAETATDLNEFGKGTLAAFKDWFHEKFVCTGNPHM